MNFSAKLFGAVFSVPTIVVDKFLKNFDRKHPEQMIALLWALRHSAEDPELDELCKILGCEKGDAEDYINYWIDRGLLVSDERQQTIQYEPPASKTQTQDSGKPEKVLEPLPISKPTNEQILKRAQESPEISFLFAEVQSKLGRTVGFDGQSTLLMMHDLYGLSVEVILMIVEYCISVDKCAYGYMAAVGKSWAEREIDTIKKADEQIEVLRCCTGAWKELSKMAGITNPRPTSSQSEYLRTWLYELKFSTEMIYLAYEEMANHCAKLSFGYMNKVLHNWYDAGIKTPAYVAESKKKFAEKGSDKKKPSKERNTSYDLEEYTHNSVYGTLVYEKKKNKKSE